MKRLLTAIACIFIVSPTYAQVDSAGDLRDSCSALVAISKGSQSPVTASKARLCLWVFSKEWHIAACVVQGASAD
jgi:hypothetical protein